MADEQDSSEFEAQLEDQAEDLRPVATDAHRELIAYAHAQMEHFQQIDGSYVQGIITYKGDFLLATFHQTSIEDIANDSWTLSIEPLSEDSDEDGENSSSLPF